MLFLHGKSSFSKLQYRLVTEIFSVCRGLFEFSTKIFHKIIFLFAATAFQIQQKILEGKYRLMKRQVN
jgi:hypothetical protein